MKILLLGEYNSSHYSLKEGLEKLGHEAIVVGSGDGFKKRKVDVLIDHRFRSGFLGLFSKALYKMTKFHLPSWYAERQIKKSLPDPGNFDIVQLINESTFKTIPRVEKRIYKTIFKRNKNVFLLSCGTDYPSVKFANDEGFQYSILSPYKNGKGTKKEFWHALMYLEKDFIKLHKFLYYQIRGVIPTDLDYYIPLKNNPKCLSLIPHPINTERIKYMPLSITEPIIIFHGINRNHYHKKGNYLFKKALSILKPKYGNKVKVIEVENLPYNEYIDSFDKAHIILDQVFAYDQGYNALEAMAKGKVVFTGAEKEWLDYYNLTEDTVAINALPNVQAIVEKLEWLIENPCEMEKISLNARNFVEKEHNYILIANKFLENWKNASIH
ncbi:glycosyltransferase [Aegicerativicinus sediminis]|uniref:glycosyltransferase n=1 Tax=Aegicerativicinus sediminis TaxID=2893202 RepID=UPI001E63B965|nr:glycosyltransferase [Aegicerativicinus sediminis]